MPSPATPRSNRLSPQRVRVAVLRAHRRRDIELAVMLIGGATVGVLAALLRLA
jgi:hypothetical protein